MDTIQLLFAYGMFCCVGIVIGALWHQKILTVIEHICAFVKAWFMD